MRLRPCLAAVLALVPLLRAAPPAGAQAAAPARIEGVVFDSLRARPLAGAAITVVQLEPARQYLSAVTDAAGRYRVDSLAAGRYSVSFGTPFLDSLEIVLPPRELAIAAGEQAHVDFATPSRTTLAAGACPGLPLARGRGAIVGQVMNAETDTPLAGATIAVSWSDLAMDLKAMRAATRERAGAVTTDSLGLYRVCNVPTETFVLLQVQRDGRAGSPLRATVPDAAGVLVQNLSLSAAAARPFNPADTIVASARDTTVTLLTGTAAVTGTVRTPDGQPVADAQLRVVDAAGTARTDATGHFSLGNLPAGTQLLEVRHVGFAIGQQPLELRAGRTITADVTLARFVLLDSVRVVAQRERLHEFERRASSGSAGNFLTETQVAQLHVTDVGDIFRNGRTLGFTVVGEGLDAKVRSTRGLSSFNMSCDANVVIDGMQHQDINLVAPSSIAGIEIYRGAAGAPAEYDSSCGVVVIWTKR